MGALAVRLVVLGGAAEALLAAPKAYRPGSHYLGPRHKHVLGAILTVGKPMEWAASRDSLAYVREHGIKQFVEAYKTSESLERNDGLVWGDEIEYGVLKVAEDKAWVSLRGPEIRDELAARELAAKERDEGCEWMPEYGSWMIEGTPKRPYSGYAIDLLRVERNMRLRRRRLLTALKPDEICPTLVNFANFGVGTFAHKDGAEVTAIQGPVARSASVPDVAIHPHPRFAALTANIRKRRGSNVDARPPLFRDERTVSSSAAQPHIEGVDAMAYGMGCCCLQVTFQARHVREARYIYDQLAVLAPVMLALTAATPVWRGLLADSDARWAVVAASVDDRTDAERGVMGGVEEEGGDPRLAGSGIRALPRSRYSSIARYAFECEEDPDRVRRLCDVDAPVDADALAALLAAGVDSALAHHVAGLFVRDPLVIFEGRVQEIDDTTATDHFDNLQSTNWNTVRLKPPPSHASPTNDAPGWRAEFRPMEVQITDFENAAYAVFSVLITRVILAFDLNLYIPISRLDANMRRAERRDAVLDSKFYFRRHMAPPPPTGGGDPDDEEDLRSCCAEDFADDAEAYEEMTCAEIIDGKGDYFPGLADLAYAYLEYIGCDSPTLDRLTNYIELVRRRARGELPTNAKWIRDFILNHQAYERDSVVSPNIARDLAVAAHDIGIGKRPAPELIGIDNTIRPLTVDGAWDVKLADAKLRRSE